MKINELKEPYKELAEKRTLEGAWVDSEELKEGDVDLFDAFEWSRTPEGHTFWEDLLGEGLPDIPEGSLKEIGLSEPSEEPVEPVGKPSTIPLEDSEGIVSWNHPEDSVAFDTYYKGELLSEATLFPEETITDHLNDKGSRKIEDYRIVERRSTVKKVKRVKQIEYRTVIQD